MPDHAPIPQDDSFDPTAQTLPPTIAIPLHSASAVPKSPLSLPEEPPKELSRLFDKLRADGLELLNQHLDAFGSEVGKEVTPANSDNRKQGAVTLLEEVGDAREFLNQEGPRMSDAFIWNDLRQRVANGDIKALVDPDTGAFKFEISGTTKEQAEEVRRSIALFNDPGTMPRVAKSLVTEKAKEVADDAIIATSVDDLPPELKRNCTARELRLIGHLWVAKTATHDEAIAAV